MSDDSDGEQVLPFKPRKKAAGMVPPESIADRNAELRAAAEERLRVALISLGGGRLERSRVRFDPSRRAIYLDALAIGCSQTKAAYYAGVHPLTPGRHRSKDKEFAAAEAEALMLGADPLIERLTDIAMHGDPAAIATIRAAETVAKIRLPQLQTRPAGAAATMRRGADGSAELSVTAASWWPKD